MENVWEEWWRVFSLNFKVFFLFFFLPFHCYSLIWCLVEPSPASAVAGKAYQLCLAGEPWPRLENVNRPEVVPHYIRADWAAVTCSALNYTYSSPGNFSRSRTRLPACFKWISCRELVEPTLEFISLDTSKCLVVSCKLPWFVSCTSRKLPLSNNWAELLCCKLKLCTIFVRFADCW